jgi:excisionase family DNA binding protein
MTKFEDYLTSDEAAEILDITPAGMRRKARLGQLDAVKRGGVWWFSRESVEQYAEMVEGKSRHDPTRGRERSRSEDDH